MKSYQIKPGDRFGKLTVIEIDKEKTAERQKRYKNHNTYWKCRCDCGNIVTPQDLTLKDRQRSCGCERKEKCKISFNIPTETKARNSLSKKAQKANKIFVDRSVVSFDNNTANDRIKKMYGIV